MQILYRWSRTSFQSWDKLHRVPFLYPVTVDYLVAQMVKRLPTTWETWVQSLGLEDLLEKKMATHSSILAWKTPWMEKPVRVQSMGLQRVRYNWETHFHHRLTHGFFRSEKPFPILSCENLAYLQLKLKYHQNIISLAELSLLHLMVSPLCESLRSLLLTFKLTSSSLWTLLLCLLDLYFDFLLNQNICYNIIATSYLLGAEGTCLSWKSRA